MTRFVANIPFDMPAFWTNNSLAEMFQFGEVTTGTNTTFVLTEEYDGGPDVLSLQGSFTEYTGDYPSFGTITSGSFARAGTSYFSFTDASMLVTDGGNVSFTWFVDTDDLHGLFAYMLRGDDEVIGSSGNDYLCGFDGNDTLTGGGGWDRLVGGSGNDTYVVDDPTDLVGEATGGGADLVVVVAGDNYTLPNSEVENLTYTGAGGFAGYGNAIANVIRGGTGNDVIDGRGGTDTMYGGDGDDYYYVESAGDVVVETATGGHDSVDTTISYTLGANIEDLFLSHQSSLGAINGTGNALDNRIQGNDSSNIIDGDAGADTMTGLGGDDHYVVDNIGDQVTEYAGGGIDIVESFISYTLTANVENLTLAGTDSINGFGNSLNNTLVGNAGSNTLDGGTGADLMTGGFGDDTFVVDEAGDQVVEAGDQGRDSVFSSITYTLTDDVETLRLLGSAALDGTGNSLDNLLVGNSGNNILDGGTGADTMKGGAGADIYYVNSSRDVVVEQGGEGTDTVRSLVSYTLGDNVEQLRLLGTASTRATGNSLNNLLVGNSGNNILDGAAGSDTMKGGAGADIYYVNSSRDVIVELGGEGLDTVRSLVSYTLSDNVEQLRLMGSASINATGNGLDNLLVGNSGNNVLDGGTGADTMKGGAGADTYYVNSSRDAVVELGGEGLDTVRSAVSYTLGDNVEQLRLMGSASINATGNSLDNLLVGNSGNNILDGGTGADTMKGGAGDDTYYVNSSRDVVVELGGEGLDTVRSLVSYTLGDNVEQLRLLGTESVRATGNSLDNLLVGNSGDNVLTGGAGADDLRGSTGGDTFVFRDGDFAGLTASTSDRINDFSHSEGDHINLAGVDANSATGGDQAFAFIGNAAFSHTAGELRYDIVNANTYLTGDTNGDGLADFMVRLDGSHALVSGDLVL